MVEEEVVGAAEAAVLKVAPLQVAAAALGLPQAESTTHIREATIWATPMRPILALDCTPTQATTLMPTMGTRVGGMTAGIKISSV